MFEPSYMFLHKDELELLKKTYDLKEYTEGDAVYYSMDADGMRFIENKPIPIGD